MTPPTKRKQLSLQEKMNLIKQHDARRGGDGKVNLSKLALEHNIPVSSLQTIIKNRDKIMNEVEEGHCLGERKRLKTSPFADVNVCVLLWFREMQSRNAPVDGPILKVSHLTETYLGRYHKGDEKGKEAIRTLKKMITEGETKKQKKLTDFLK